MWRHNFINSYDPVGKPSDLPTLHSRLFRRMKFTQTDSAEERHSSNLDDFFGSIWSLKSKISNKTLETVKKYLKKKLIFIFLLDYKGY